MRKLSPRASIEDGNAPLTNAVSDSMDDQSETDEFQSPDPDDVEQRTEPEKRSLSLGEESDDEGANEQTPPPVKRQRRSQANDSGAPRRSKRISSNAAVKDEKPVPVSTTGKKRRGRPPTKSKAASLSKSISSPISGEDEDAMTASAPVKKRRGRPPAKRKTATRESVARRGPGRPPSKGKVTRRESTTEWEVEKVLKSKVDTVSKEHLYLIKWKGFGNKENTWEPKKNLGNCKRLIEDYESKE
ncbi:Testis-specific chromodomain protein Y 1 [Fusarium austroafricanum]|uniref:Testis-specific chromodomain protein Y 1 n=1 Tax=Fusarium austroafricanum TaxID=2364996 RepID=A0A8H4KGB2_9HYPO|nr:Testis-specific chromodomain protein Y 1 [Fusarium austroafricanum]